jgi:uncharacterized repeat protein (TIGR01451 family)
VSCTPIAQPTPRITVDKTDANPNDLDANVDDSQTVNTGSSAVFGITVTNNGEENLTNVVLTDPRSPSCNRTATQTATLIRGVGNRDTIFDIGESFTYTCSLNNTTASFVNTISVRGTGVDSGTVVDDNDPTNVFVLPVPEMFDLALRKTLAASTPGPFTPGDTVRFNIQVINQGNIVATNTEVTDYIPEGLTFVPGNGWSVGPNNTVTRVLRTIPVGGVLNLPITFTIDAGVTGSITNLAEISSDSGDDCDSTPDNNPNNDGTPDDNAVGTGCNPGGDEDDHDPETIEVVDQVFDLALRKTVSSTTPGPFTVGDTITFDIEVINQGDIDAVNVEVTDYIPTGLTLNDTDWTLSGDQATIVVASIPAGQTVTTPITFTINAEATGMVINFAEISEDNNDDCDSTADDTNGNQPGENDGTEVNDDIGDGCNPGGDEDDSDFEPVPLVVFDLALRKTVSSTTPGPFTVGDTITFDIEVINQGDIDAVNVEVTDYIPTGLTLNDTDWTLSGDQATIVVASIPAGQTVTTPITFTINAEATGMVINFAEISEDNNDDCDSTADDTNGNQPGENDGTEVNDDIGDGCNPGGDEDDSDLEPIVIEGPSITVDKTDNNSADQDGVVRNDSQTISSGENAVFEITVTNDGTEGLTNIVLSDPLGPNCAGNVTLPSTAPATFLTFTHVGNNDAVFDPGETFTYTCDRPNTTESFVNTVTVEANGVDSETPVNDNDPTNILLEGPICTNLTASPSTGVDSLSSNVVCTGENVTTFQIDCGNGVTFTGSGSNNGTETFARTCNYTTVGSFTPTCTIDDTVTNNSCQQTVTVTDDNPPGGGG